MFYQQNFPRNTVGAVRRHHQRRLHPQRPEVGSKRGKTRADDARPHLLLRVLAAQPPQCQPGLHPARRRLRRVAGQRPGQQVLPPPHFPRPRRQALLGVQLRRDGKVRRPRHRRLRAKGHREEEARLRRPLARHGGADRGGERRPEPER